MRYFSLFKTAFRWLLVAAFLSAGLAMAQQEPSMSQIYATAESGKLDQAQVMVQQVLVAHPKSAKAYFVQSELYARQGNLPKARESLSEAKSLAPGLPFAKAEAVQALESQLTSHAVQTMPTTQFGGTNSGAASSSHSSGGWMLPAVLAVVVIGGAYFIFRRKPTQTYDQSNGLNGPQGFGNSGMQSGYGQPQPAYQNGYGQAGGYGPGYGQPYGQQPGTGLGGKIMGGVATGLAVGAGVVAAEAIGRSIMGNHDSGSRSYDTNSGNNYNAFDNNSNVNRDMGGQNFGISDTSWDDAGSSDSGGGGNDWDN